MDEPNPHQMVLELKPLDGGAFTHLSLHGPLCSAPQGKWLRYLLRIFSFWNGYRVRVVLSVDAKTDAWWEVWTDALSAASHDHLEVQFRIRGTGQ
jgi:hypothetical protein